MLYTRTHPTRVAANAFLYWIPFPARSLPAVRISSCRDFNFFSLRLNSHLERDLHWMQPEILDDVHSAQHVPTQPTGFHRKETVSSANLWNKKREKIEQQHSLVYIWLKNINKAMQLWGCASATLNKNHNFRVCWMIEIHKPCASPPYLIVSSMHNAYCCGYERPSNYI